MLVHTTFARIISVSWIFSSVRETENQSGVDPMQLQTEQRKLTTFDTRDCALWEILIRLCHVTSLLSPLLGNLHKTQHPQRARSFARTRWTVETDYPSPRDSERERERERERENTPTLPVLSHAWPFWNTLTIPGCIHVCFGNVLSLQTSRLEYLLHQSAVRCACIASSPTGFGDKRRAELGNCRVNDNSHNRNLG